MAVIGKQTDNKLGLMIIWRPRDSAWDTVLFLNALTSMVSSYYLLTIGDYDDGDDGDNDDELSTHILLIHSFIHSFGHKFIYSYFI